MRLIITGSRSIDLYYYIERAVEEALDFWDVEFEDVECVVSGRSFGSDRLGERWAINQGITIRTFPANLEDFSPRVAHRIRNDDMIKYGTHLVLVWDGTSFDTKDMINRAKKNKLPYRLFNINEFDIEVTESEEDSKLSEVLAADSFVRLGSDGSGIWSLDITKKGQLVSLKINGDISVEGNTRSEKKRFV
jgi:hypothetical protein